MPVTLMKKKDSKWAKNLCKKEHIQNVRQATWYWKSTMSLAFAYFKPKIQIPGMLQLITHYSRLLEEVYKIVKFYNL